AEQPACFTAFGAVTHRAKRERAQVLSVKVFGRSVDTHKAETQLRRFERFEAIAVPKCSVENIVIGPGQRPVITAVGRPADGVGRGPPNLLDQGAVWDRIRGGGSCLLS